MRKSNRYTNFEHVSEISTCNETERHAIGVNSWIAHGVRLLVIGSGAVVIFVGSVWAQDFDRGKLEYTSKCAVCHGMDAKGGGPFASQLKTVPADLTQLANKNGGIFPEAAVKETIDGMKDVAAHGPRDMPVWGYRYRDASSRGEKTRLEALIDHLRRIQQK